MKLFFLVLFIQVSLLAQNTSVPKGVQLTPDMKVPSIVYEKFRRDFPKVTGDWQNVEDSAYVVSFRDDSTQLPRVVVYDYAGERLEMRSRLESGSYPKTIDRYFLDNDPLGKYQMWRIDQKERLPGYFGISENDTTWFDAKGVMKKRWPPDKSPADDN